MRLRRVVFARRGAVLCLSLALGACMTPASRTPGPAGPTAAFWRDPPRCVVVLPVVAEGEVSARMAEHALARHLSGRVATVLGPDARDRLTRHLALGLGDAAGSAYDRFRVAKGPKAARKRFADLTGCGYAAALSLHATRRFALVWGEARVELALRIVDLRDGTVLWQGRQRASRGAGGLPASPVGLALAMGQAGHFVADGDLLASVLDDGLRALLAGLPDMRGAPSALPPSLGPIP